MQKFLRSVVGQLGQILATGLRAGAFLALCALAMAMAAPGGSGTAGPPTDEAVVVDTPASALARDVAIRDGIVLLHVRVNRLERQLEVLRKEQGRMVVHGVDPAMTR